MAVCSNILLFSDDYGIKAVDAAHVLGSPTFEHLLQSDEMRPYVRLEFDEENIVFHGVVFENPFLKQLLDQQRDGQDEVTFRCV